MKTFPLLDFGLGETANLMRESVQEFVGAEIAPIASDIDRNDEFPPELWQKMGAVGGKTPPQFLSTHPSPVNRQENLSKMAEQLMHLYLDEGDRPVYLLQ